MGKGNQACLDVGTFGEAHRSVYSSGLLTPPCRHECPASVAWFLGFFAHSLACCRPVAPQVVSLLHSVFDFMAFKNDVAFWKDNRSMEGLSARSILVNAFCQLVIVLYLFDNETSTVVLISSGARSLLDHPRS